MTAPKTPAGRLAYMADPRYLLLRQACEREPRTKVAQRLNVSPAAVGQVLNGSGLYGSGQASPEKLLQRVLHKFGQFECPHLSERFAEPRFISAAECRQHAHQPNPPVGSPQALLHWRACAGCKHKALSAPAPAKPTAPRKRKAKAGSAEVDGAASHIQPPARQTEETTA